MNTEQLLEKIQFVVDVKGNQSGVILGLNDWEQLLIHIEDLEDANEIHQVRKENEEVISWEQAKIEIGIGI
jgi:hypothetical protein